MACDHARHAMGSWLSACQVAPCQQPRWLTPWWRRDFLRFCRIALAWRLLVAHEQHTRVEHDLIVKASLDMYFESRIVLPRPIAGPTAWLRIAPTQASCVPCEMLQSNTHHARVSDHLWAMSHSGAALALPGIEVLVLYNIEQELVLHLQLRNCTIRNWPVQMVPTLAIDTEDWTGNALSPQEEEEHRLLEEGSLCAARKCNLDVFAVVPPAGWAEFASRVGPVSNVSDVQTTTSGLPLRHSDLGLAYSGLGSTWEHRDPRLQDKASAWLQHSTEGYCGRTERLDGLADCSTDPAGTWDLDALGATNWTTASVACVERCVACKRCHYLAISVAFKYCSWYHRCPQRFTDRGSFRTGRVHHNVETTSANVATPSSSSASLLPTPINTTVRTAVLYAGAFEFPSIEMVFPTHAKHLFTPARARAFIYLTPDTVHLPSDGPLPNSASERHTGGTQASHTAICERALMVMGRWLAACEVSDDLHAPAIDDLGVYPFGGWESLYFQVHKIALAWRLLLAYEHRKGVRHDLVVRVRLDMYLENRVVLPCPAAGPIAWLRVAPTRMSCAPCEMLTSIAVRCLAFELGARAFSSCCQC